MGTALPVSICALGCPKTEESPPMPALSLLAPGSAHWPPLSPYFPFAGQIAWFGNNASDTG